MLAIEHEGRGGGEARYTHKPVADVSRTLFLNETPGAFDSRGILLVFD